ncbi:MAG: hypothetical protein GXY99_01215 [Clostridiaceae bacterium]|nr:hypothetical protein [Clostridiaceae bacterium]
MARGKYSLRSIALRVPVILVGVLIQAFGMASIIMANLGSDPITAFAQGLGNVLGLSFGNAMIIYNIVFLLAVLFLDRKTIGVGTVLHAVTVGAFVDMVTPWVGKMAGPAPVLSVKIMLLLAGTVLLAVGLGFYQSAEFGLGSPDAFNQIIARKLKMQLRWWRMIFDGLMIVGALIMGGVVHAGTLLGMLMVGPIMGPLINKMAPLVNKWSGNEDLIVEVK